MHRQIHHHLEQARTLADCTATRRDAILHLAQVIDWLRQEQRELIARVEQLELKPKPKGKRK